ncbi:Uncharacterised protein [Collinsella aerofaciens]|uniref:Uncharacterized protein n=1 Tax=Collinsella aerofaciens TaxID=74426 RepID=A0A173ZG71_9ACTN|nr:Uncharacterised protein [Collinsella aerofaciens]
MCGDEYALAGEHLGANLVFEIRPGAGNRIFEALGIGQLIGRDVAVLLLGVGVATVARLERRRAHVEGAAPDEHLLVAVLRRGIGLVETLQRAVVALVELPGFDDGQPFAIHLAEHDVEGVNCTLETRGVADVKVETGFFEGAAACGGFFTARVGELDIGPAGEQVEFVPLGFSVTDKDKLHRLLVCLACHGGLLDLARRACRLLDAAKDTRFSPES